MYILASKSPRRIELLKKIIKDFLIVPADIDETIYPIEEVSFQKGKKIADSFPNDIVISADTIVKLSDTVYGKPTSKLDAFNILKSLSNKTHEVITYYTIMSINKNILINKKVISYVTFNNLDDQLINDYIASNSPLDKAGAYGIQDNDCFPIIKNYQGSLDNIIGFPLEEIKNDLISLGLKIQPK